MSEQPAISGATIAYRAVSSGYPVAESLSSMLPICREVIVNLGLSDDGTKEAVMALNSPKIRLIEEPWDMSVRVKGLTLSRETNRALDRCSGEWILYLQADEVLHERDLPEITELIRCANADRSIDGISFRYLHFYGNFGFVQDHFRRWYPRAVRAVRNDPAIRSVGDALKFRRMIRGRPRRLRALRSGATIFHYGWARPPEIMVAKQRQFERFYRDGEDWQRKADSLSPENVYSDLGNLRPFAGSHPRVMAGRIEAANWEFNPRLERQLPRPLRLLIIAVWYPLSRGWVKTLARVRDWFCRDERPAGRTRH